MLTYQLDPLGNESLYAQLYRFIRHDIAHGTIQADGRLPSKRALAAHLGVGTVTVESAYRQLVAEGYVRAEERRGYFANRLAPAMIPSREGPHAEASAPARSSADASRLVADFTTGSAATRCFPYDIWARAMRETLAEESAASLAEAARAQGSLRLRTAIASHLRGSRGMVVRPEDIVVGAGAQTLHQLVIQLLGRDRIFAAEDPGYPRLAQIYRTNDVTVTPVPLESDGMLMRSLRASGASVAHLMPSHQFPTGIVTSAARRRDLLNWAREPHAMPASGDIAADGATTSQHVGEPKLASEASPGTTGRYLIEDDYDSDFRLSGRPIPPLFSIDAAKRVIYLGSFANTLGAAFRFGYLVLPTPLSASFAERLGFYSNTVSPIDQLALARFIEHGHYERHVNRLRTRVRSVQNELVSALRASSIGSRLSFRGLDGGLHFLMGVAGADENAVTRAAREEGVALAPLSQFRIARGADGDPGWPAAEARSEVAPACAWFVMRYSALSCEQIPAAVDAIARAIGNRNG